jgi:hypothetical protein
MAGSVSRRSAIHYASVTLRRRHVLKCCNLQLRLKNAVRGGRRRSRRFVAPRLDAAQLHLVKCYHHLECGFLHEDLAE